MRSLKGGKYDMFENNCWHFFFRMYLQICPPSQRYEDEWEGMIGVNFADIEELVLDEPEDEESSSSWFSPLSVLS